MSTELAIKQTQALANAFNVDGNPEHLMQTLKVTAFKNQEVTDEQFVALMIVAAQYKLNPFTNEIYAFPSNGSIVPMVGVDGWARIINSHPQFDGIEFQQDAESCTCRIFRKDRNHPVTVTEFMNECRRSTKPWQSHPRRMLRHKTMIQAARLAFGYAGIFDEDEGERITAVQNAPIKSPFTGDATIENREELIAAGEKIAETGDKEAVRSYLKSLTKQERSAIGSEEMARMGDLADSAAMNVINHDDVIDGEITEVISDSTTN